MSIKGYDLKNSTYYIGTGNFTVNVTNISSGNSMVNDSYVNITGSYLYRSNDTYKTNETMYLYITIPAGPLPSLPYSSSSSWIVAANK